MAKKPLISIVTPCYNEQENVHTHFARVCAAIEPFRAKYDFEHLYTDNCSEDRTFELLTALSAQHENFRVLRFSRNIGPDRAVYFGLEHARGDAIVLIQADLQDPPELIPDFIRGYEEGFDVVYGVIAERREGFVMRNMREAYYRIVASLSDLPIPRNAGDFRLTSRRALDAVLQFRENDLYLRGAVAQVGFPQKPIPFVRAERAGGRSSARFRYLVRYAINGVLSTTVVPIRAVSLCGAVVASIGFVLTVLFAAGKVILPGQSPHGFTTLASLITFFSGVQLLAIGVIGEYLCKTYLQCLGRPRGFIQDKVGFEVGPGHDEAAVNGSETPSRR